MEARSKVEHVSLAKLKEWRDEAGEQSNELEDTFREVIVLDDDDEASSEGDSLSTPDEREQSMEIVSSRATARDLQPEYYANPPHLDVHDSRRAPRRTIVLQRYPPPPHPMTVLQPPFEHVRAHIPHSATLSSHGDSHRHLHTRPNNMYAKNIFREYTIVDLIRPMQASPAQSSPKRAPILREIDGRLYEVSCQ